jgi:hypothetical protein
MVDRETGIKARAALEAWLKGMTQGGHTPTPEDIRETFRIALAHYREESC